MNLLPAAIVLLDEQQSDGDHHRRQAQVAAGVHALRPELVIGDKGGDAKAKLGREDVGRPAPARGLAVTFDPDKWRLEVITERPVPRRTSAFELHESLRVSEAVLAGRPLQSTDAAAS